jgi:UDP-N-acetylmuramyl pentapeptide phosphotransferase/UDP-N-acetylglucosamine-1-phosphate transferase
VLDGIFLAAAFGLPMAIALVAAARFAAHRRMLLDHPNERSLHVRPTPRGGGVGLVVPICAAVLTTGVSTAGSLHPAIWMAGIGLMVAAVGLADDVRGLPALGRLAVHAVAAALVVIGIGTWRIFEWPGLWRVDLDWAAIPLTVTLVVGLINAYNFMDGVDGIAGSQGVVAGFGWMGAGYAIDDPLLAVAGSAIAATSLGFLFFNWSPASVFMGDVGSSFLGYSFAVLAIVAAPRSPVIATAGALFVWPFVFDSGFTFLRRLWRRENVLSAHRTHLYQRLVLTGVSHRTVALLYGFLALAGVATGYVLVREGSGAGIAGAVLIGSLAAGLLLAVSWRERRTNASCLIETSLV